MTAPQDPDRLVGRTVAVEIDGASKVARVVSVGLGGIMLEVDGRDVTLPPSELRRLDIAPESS